MKKNIIYLIFISIVFFGFINSVDAALDIRISTDSATKLAPGSRYNVSYVYVDLDKNLGTLSSLDFDYSYQNTNCAVISGSCNANNHCSYTNVAKGATLLSLSCVKGNNNESFYVGNAVANKKTSLRSASLSISTETTTTSTEALVTTPVVTTTTTTKRTTKKSSSTTTTTTTEVVETTEPVELPVFPEEKSELKLKSLKVIGYDIAFNKDTFVYTIKVRDDVLALDVVATPMSRDIVVENTGKINIKDLDYIDVNLLRDDEKVTYTIKIEKEEVKKVNYLLMGIVIFLIFVFGGLIIMQLINRHNIRKEDFDVFKEIDDGKEDAEQLLEEEEEFTKTFFDLNKR